MGLSHIKPGHVKVDGVLLRAADYQAFLKAEAILAQARAHARAQKIKSCKAAKILQKKGFGRGLVAARQERAKRALVFVRDALHALENLEDVLVQIIKEALVTVIGEMDTDALTRRVVRRALHQYRNLPEARLRVCPAQKNMLQKHIEDFGHQSSFVRTEADPRLKPGDCILESPLGVVNMSLKHQLRALTAALKPSQELSLGRPRAKKQ